MHVKLNHHGKNASGETSNTKWFNPFDSAWVDSHATATGTTRDGKVRHLQYLRGPANRHLADAATRSDSRNG